MSELEMCELFSKNLPFYDKINEAERSTILRSSQYVCFSRGTNIHDGGECTGVILIKKGTLRVYIISEDGKEITLYRLFDHDICLFSASCVMPNIQFEVIIEAEKDCADVFRKIDENAFNYCTGLKKINIPKGVTIIERRAFNNCSSLKKINIPNSVYYIAANALTGLGVDTLVFPENYGGELMFDLSSAHFFR